jgi:hypothetical protein
MPETCHFCTRTLGTLRDGDAALVNGCHWTGAEYARVDLCAGCFDAGKLATAPRRPRRPRTTAVPTTDWNQLVAFTRKGRRPAR